MTKKILRILVFLILIVIFMNIAGKIFEPKWYDEWMNTAVVDEFYELPKNSIDVLAIGSSQIIKGFSALELYKNFGFSGYGLGTEQQSIQNSYAWLKESLKTQNEKVVLLEVKMLFEDTPEAQNRKGVDNMKFSANKLELLVSDSIEEKSYTNFISYVFPITRFHTRWKEITEEDFTKEHSSKCFRGYSLDNEYCGNEDYKPLNEEITDTREITSRRIKYFQKIVKLCEENDITLILYKNQDMDWDEERYNAIKNLAEQNSLTYIDFNTPALVTELGFNYAKDCENTNHLNIYGVQKNMQYLGDYISNNIQLEDKRGKEEYNYLDKELEEYNYAVENGMLVNIYETGSYIDSLKSDDFVIMISKKGNFTEEIDEESKETLARVGLDPSKIISSNYGAILENGNKVIEEANDSNPIQFTKDFEVEKTATINTSEKASIIFEGVELSNSHAGLNILVYNNKNDEVVESSYIDFSQGSLVMGR